MRCDIQAKVDAVGGLQGIQQLNPAQLQQLADEIGVKDSEALLEEVGDCLHHIGATVEKIDEGVQGVKAAVEGQDKHFMELRQMMEQLVHQFNGKDSSKPAVKVDLSLWKLKEQTVLDKSQLLGSGSFGQVYAGIYQGRKVAYKVLNSSVAGMSDLQKEVSLHLKVCSCPGVVQILAVSLQADAMCDVPCVVMERAMGSLADFIYPVQGSTTIRSALPSIDLSLTGKLVLMTQVASALEYVSAAGLVHRDIKTSNILLFQEGGGGGGVIAKICDFGLSKSLAESIDKSSRLSIKGTALYLAPETYDMQYTAASDVYAYAITLNEVLTESCPVPESLARSKDAPGQTQIMKAVYINSDRPVIYSEPGMVGDAIRRLIRQSWHQDPQQRCSFARITTELPAIVKGAMNITVKGSARIDPGALRNALHLYDNAPGFPSSSPSAVAVRPASASGAAAAAASAGLGTRRELADLSTEELGALLESMNLHVVKEKLALRRVTGRLLSYCTSEEDLLDEVYGLSSKVLARGLMEQIKLWKANGV
jgi:serine/threonine protein kinase